jgi:folate-binding Fe-S cluster repair protein YgfZ
VEPLGIPSLCVLARIKSIYFTNHRLLAPSSRAREEKMFMNFFHSHRFHSTWLRGNVGQIPIKACARLDSRSVIRLSGPQSHKFLQGIVAQHMDLIFKTRGIYSGVLTNSGRVLADIFIYASRIESEYFLECDSAIFAGLVEHLRKYKLKTEIQIDDLSKDYTIWSLWGDFNTGMNFDLLGLKDPRCPDMGFRCLIPSNVGYSEFVEDRFGSDFPIVSDRIYQMRRILLGIPEGRREFGENDSFPLEFNMDLMNGSKDDRSNYGCA